MLVNTSEGAQGRRMIKHMRNGVRIYSTTLEVDDAKAEYRITHDLGTTDIIVTVADKNRDTEILPSYARGTYHVSIVG